MEQFSPMGTGTAGRVELECPSTAQRRENLTMPSLAAAHPPANNARRGGLWKEHKDAPVATRVMHTGYVRGKMGLQPLDRLQSIGKQLLGILFSNTTAASQFA